MWKTVAKFISEPVYHEVQFMKFYKATLENKEGKFVCSFGEKYLLTQLDKIKAQIKDYEKEHSS